jgi:hypothetical protein
MLSWYDKYVSPGLCTRGPLPYHEYGYRYRYRYRSESLRCVRVRVWSKSLQCVLRVGERGQRAAYRQLEGLKSCKKTQEFKCFEWEILFETANNIVDWLPGPKAKLANKTLCCAYLDSFPGKWISDFEQIHTLDMALTTISAITSFMTDREDASKAAQLENESKQKAALKKHSLED